jgi:hypothetical protein
VKRGVRERREGTRVATALEKLAVHVDNAPRAGLLVKIVDVLCAQKKPVVERLFERGEGKMPRVWLGGGCDLAAHGIEIPNEPRITPPGERGGNFFDSMLAPKSASIAESGNTAFGAYAGTSKNKNAVGGRDGELCHWRDQRDSNTPRSIDCPKILSRFRAEELQRQAMCAVLTPASPRISARMLETTPGTLAATSGDNDMPAEKSRPSMP